MYLTTLSNTFAYILPFTFSYLHTFYHLHYLTTYICIYFTLYICTFICNLPVYSGTTNSHNAERNSKEEETFVKVASEQNYQPDQFTAFKILDLRLNIKHLSFDIGRVASE